MKCNWQFSVLVFTCLVPALSNHARPDEWAPLLKTILAVGPEGRGHREAQAAWRDLTRADAQALPDVLTALDEANPLAANWLRSAVETIADRQLDRGDKLPAAKLEAFVLDVRHHPRGRRLAFELLVKADSTAPDRLIPGMLEDPSAEFRRDAVQRLLDEAAQLKAPEQSDDALRIYRQAFSGAWELDQADAIAQALENLGHPVNLSEHLGCIMDWKLIGPFDNTAKKGYKISYPPETEIDLAARYAGKTADVTWTSYLTNDKYGVVDLVKVLGKGQGAVAYAVTEFSIDADEVVEIRLASSNAWKVWVNGQLISECHDYHRRMEPARDAWKTFLKPQFDQFQLKAALKKGSNTILLKICQNEQTEDWAQLWQFQMRVCDVVGKSILSKSHHAVR